VGELPRQRQIYSYGGKPKVYSVAEISFRHFLFVRKQHELQNAKEYLTALSYTVYYVE